MKRYFGFVFAYYIIIVVVVVVLKQYLYYMLYITAGIAGSVPKRQKKIGTS